LEGYKSRRKMKRKKVRTSALPGTNQTDTVGAGCTVQYQSGSVFGTPVPYFRSSVLELSTDRTVPALYFEQLRPVQ
jgi:hypothetical protein